MVMIFGEFILKWWFIVEIFQKPWTKGCFICNFFKKLELSFKKLIKSIIIYSFILFIYLKYKVIHGLWELAKDNQLFSNFWEPALWELVFFFKIMLTPLPSIKNLLIFLGRTEPLCKLSLWKLDPTTSIIKILIPAQHRWNPKNLAGISKYIISK
jgi:hypothetical protein